MSKTGKICARQFELIIFFLRENIKSGDLCKTFPQIVQTFSQKKIIFVKTKFFIQIVYEISNFRENNAFLFNPKWSQKGEKKSEGQNAQDIKTPRCYQATYGLCRCSDRSWARWGAVHRSPSSSPSRPRGGWGIPAAASSPSCGSTQRYSSRPSPARTHRPPPTTGIIETTDVRKNISLFWCAK